MWSGRAAFAVGLAGFHGGCRLCAWRAALPAGCRGLRWLEVRPSPRGGKGKKIIKKRPRGVDTLGADVVDWYLSPQDGGRCLTAKGWKEETRDARGRPRGSDGKTKRSAGRGTPRRTHRRRGNLPRSFLYEGDRVDAMWNLLAFGPKEYIMESSILAQNERWRRVLSMQVEREYPACWI